MARQARVVIPGVAHQVGTRGNNKRRIFSHPSDYRAFIRYLWLALIDTNCLLHQLTLMINHVHMIVTPPSAGALSDLMKWSLGRYAQVRNQKKASTGHLFEGRYFSKVIDRPRYLPVATMYNDANLAHTGLIDDPTLHEWSTCGIHAGVPERSSIPIGMWTPSPWYVSLGKTPDERADAYRALLSNHMVVHPLEVDRELATYERPAIERYTRRIQRPNGLSAREPKIRYGRKAQ
jgi:putative transposase